LVGKTHGYCAILLYVLWLWTLLFILLFFVVLFCCDLLRSAQQAVAGARIAQALGVIGNIALLHHAFLGQQPAVLAVVGAERGVAQRMRCAARRVRLCSAARRGVMLCYALFWLARRARGGFINPLKVLSAVLMRFYTAFWLGRRMDIALSVLN
jgi:hypothetical protein